MIAVELSLRQQELGQHEDGLVKAVFF